MAKEKIFDTIKELNTYLTKSKKRLLVKNGKIVGLLGDEFTFYSNRKRRKKK